MELTCVQIKAGEYRPGDTIDVEATKYFDIDTAFAIAFYTKFKEKYPEIFEGMPNGT